MGAATRELVPVADGRLARPWKASARSESHQPLVSLRNSPPIGGTPLLIRHPGEGRDFGGAAVALVVSPAITVTIVKVPFCWSGEPCAYRGVAEPVAVDSAVTWSAVGHLYARSSNLSSAVAALRNAQSDREMVRFDSGWAP